MMSSRAWWEDSGASHGDPTTGPLVTAKCSTPIDAAFTLERPVRFWPIGPRRLYRATKHLPISCTAN